MPSSNRLSIDYSKGAALNGHHPDLYIRMLSLFPDDHSFSRLEAALARGDVKDAFLHAHTLKGLCAQLALCALFDVCSALCDLLREESAASLVQARAMLLKLSAVYADTISEIELLLLRLEP